MDLLFEFNVDKAAKKVFITREFDAPLSLVWEAFTRQELLDQWTAPAPFTAKTKYMNFEVGGKRLYAMVSPEGQERWVIQEYISISPTAHFKLMNAFADENGNPELTGSEWDYHFSEQDGKTTVRITIFNESFERMERMLTLGFKEGFTATLTNLEIVLAGEKYIMSQAEPKRSDLQVLHRFILQIMPNCKLWYLDGRDETGKIVSNPNIGYGLRTIQYADGKTRDFYQIGLSANTTGISVYIMGIADKTYLPNTYKEAIGKASVSGYCIKFKTLKDINLNVLEAAIRDAFTTKINDQNF